MPDVITATGSTLSIGPSVTADMADTLAEFEGLTYTLVGMVETLGDVGDESAIITIAIIGDGRMRKAKGARDAGTMAITVAHVGDEAGQSAMEAAERTYSNYAFKVVIPDKLNATGTDSVRYFRGLVASQRLQIGGNDNIIRKTYNLTVNSEITVKPATAGAI